jgi:hypothetical protein
MITIDEWQNEEAEKRYQENYQKNLKIWLNGAKKGLEVRKNEKKNKRS